MRGQVEAWVHILLGFVGFVEMRNNVVQLLYFFMEWNIVKSQRLVWSYTLCLQILIGTY